ncbi:4-(cytidine 5'-diphospho)-2-C-methyl-D-erythritol kinase [Patescibacteria group bacterium]|nr:4-(cytidine 5'-diphospho)-2-C-methyl-D-erythritol kinase [Patescibacteria group bacterium]MCL5091372.1 4-(cytidine 5'-diphospho)-2-C-methyl-D-erythritol kinase [Patescibacteria group bacterium]
MLKVKAYAKLNLNLHVLPRRLSSGLFPVRFLNCQINLFDELRFVRQNKSIDLVSDDPRLDHDGNLIVKAARLLKHMLGDENLGVKINLKKNIPVKAGLAGGSCDAAATLTALTKLWRYRPGRIDLDRLADQLGKDVHYCLRGGLCQIEGDGGRVVSLPFRLPRLWLVIVVPEPEKPATAWMYGRLNPNLIGRHLEELEEIKAAVKIKNKSKTIDHLFNDFSDAAFTAFPSLRQVTHNLIDAGARQTLLLGSGLALAGFFLTRSAAWRAYRQLTDKYSQAIWTHTI